MKKNIFGKPSPYVKLSIMPSRRHLRSWKQHHGQIAKTSSQTNTINPKWSSEVSSVMYSSHAVGGKCVILPLVVLCHTCTFIRCVSTIKSTKGANFQRSSGPCSPRNVLDFNSRKSPFLGFWVILKNLVHLCVSVVSRTSNCHLPQEGN